jgi:hypothetical protein
LWDLGVRLQTPVLQGQSRKKAGRAAQRAM